MVVGCLWQLKIREMLDKCKNLTFTASNVKILSSLNEDSATQLYALANDMINN